MTNKVLSLVALFLFFLVGGAFAQDDMTVIGDERAKDAEQQAQWREGQTAFPSKPRNMWEIGLYGGTNIVAGDVDGALGWQAGLTVRKAISYVLSIRVGGSYGSAQGYDARPTSYDRARGEFFFRQNPALEVYDGGQIHRNYQTNIIQGNVELLVSIGNILFHSAEPKWNAYVGLGIGYHQFDVSSNLLDGQSAYNWDPVTSGLDLTDRGDRSEARSNLRDLLDDDFEQEEIEDPNGASAIHGLASLGISRKIGDRFNIGLEYQLMLTGDDYTDGYQAGSRSADIVNFFNLRLGFNLGNPEKRVEPLYWVNPLDAPMNDIAELKQRPKFDLTDTDGDGVIDMIDQEPESMAGCPVDTRGITLDSDGDGIVDCKDEEPYSPPGYTVNEQGVANVTTPYLTESEVRAIVDERPLPKTEWFLPMVHFDLDKYYIKPQYYGALANVAQVLKAHPNLSLVATGYHDNRGSDDYNHVLAYNRAEAVVNALVEKMGISRDRLYIQYSDEQLIEGLPSNYGTTYTEERAQYMNRRVEFTIADGNATNAQKPEGEAGSNTPGSARDGDKYSGNRNSGY